MLRLSQWSLNHSTKQIQEKIVNQEQAIPEFQNKAIAQNTNALRFVDFLRDEPSFIKDKNKKSKEVE